MVICMCTADMQQNIYQRSRLSKAPDLRLDKLFCCQQLTRLLGFELHYAQPAQFSFQEGNRWWLMLLLLMLSSGLMLFLVFMLSLLLF